MSFRPTIEWQKWYTQILPYLSPKKTPSGKNRLFYQVYREGDKRVNMRELRQVIHWTVIHSGDKKEMVKGLQEALNYETIECILAVEESLLKENIDRNYHSKHDYRHFWEMAILSLNEQEFNLNTLDALQDLYLLEKFGKNAISTQNLDLLLQATEQAIQNKKFMDFGGNQGAEQIRDEMIQIRDWLSKICLNRRIAKAPKRQLVETSKSQKSVRI